MYLQEVELVVGELVVLEAEAEQVGVLECLLDGHPLPLVHLQAPLHEPQRVLLDFAQVPHLDGLSPLHHRQLDSFELGVPPEMFPLL